MGKILSKKDQIIVARPGDEVVWDMEYFQEHEEGNEHTGEIIRRIGPKTICKVLEVNIVRPERGLPFPHPQLVKIRGFNKDTGKTHEANVSGIWLLKVYKEEKPFFSLLTKKIRNLNFRSLSLLPD